MTRVAAVQLALTDEEDPSTRRHRVRQLIAGIDAELILMPELWEVGPFAVAENLDLAVPLETWVRHMSDLAPGRTLHAGSFLERDGDDLYNTSVVFGPDGDVLATYRKIHLFGFDTGEAVTLAAGRDIVTVETPLGTTGLATCYDLRFPEMFRTLTDAGAQAPWLVLGGTVLVAVVSALLVLSIVRSIVEGHGGRVWVRSIVGVGSQFIVEFAARPRP